MLVLFEFSTGNDVEWKEIGGEVIIQMDNVNRSMDIKENIKFIGTNVLINE